MSIKPDCSNSPFMPISNKSVFCKKIVWVDVCCAKIFPKKNYPNVITVDFALAVEFAQL